MGPTRRRSVPAPPSLSRSSPPSPPTGSPSTAQVSIGRLPATSKELFGRDAELAWLDACWQGGTRVASIIAFGGIGKSALVNAWLARMDIDGYRGAQRVYGWSFYGQGTDHVSSSDEFIEVTLRWFGDPEPTRGSAWEKGARLAALVRKERTLLVLDGLEPLQWGPNGDLGTLKDMALRALVKELAAQNPGLCVITSRIAVADLEALVGNQKVEAHNLDHLSDEAGAELLRAQGVRGLKEELRAAVREYEGHGLALTLLGTYVRKAHQGDIRKRDLIPPFAGKSVERMMATYERWFADKPELAILRMLGLFDRPAPADELEAVLAKPPIAGLTDIMEGQTVSGLNEAVTTLRDVGLLAACEGKDDRFDAHPLVREHFGEQLRRGQVEAWREGHRRLYEHMKTEAKALPDTIEEMGPLYAAVVHGCCAGKYNDAFDIYWKRIQREGEAFSMYRLGAHGSSVYVLSHFFSRRWDKLVAYDSPWKNRIFGSRLRSWAEPIVLNHAGNSLLALGRLDEAKSALLASMHAHLVGDAEQGAALDAVSLSEISYLRGELREAEEYAQKSIRFAKWRGNKDRRDRTRASLIRVQHARGDRGAVAAHLDEMQNMWNVRVGRDEPQFGVVMFEHCMILLDWGKGSEALGYLERTPCPHEGAPLDLALNALSLGRAHLLGIQRGTGGDLAAATSHIQHAVDGLRLAGEQSYLPLGLLARAALHTHTRDFPAARRDLDETLTLATRCGFRLHEADAHLGHARLGLAESRPEFAREHLGIARRIVDETGYHRRDEELAELEAEMREMV